MISFKFDINSSELESGILKEFAAHISLAFRKALPVVNSQVEKMVEEALKSSPTWNSILAGDVQATLLVPAARHRVKRNI